MFLILCFILVLPFSEARAYDAGKVGSLYDPAPAAREISGYVTGLGTLLSNALIRVKNSERQTITDDKGYYSIEAAKGEVLVYSFMGLKPMEVIVEDVTKKLNINLVSESRMLSEVKLSASSNSVSSSDEIDSYFGKMDRKKLGTSSYYVDGENLNLGAIYLMDALVGKVPGFNVVDDGKGARRVYFRSQVPNSSSAALWDIDGVLYQNEPPFIDLTNIESVNVIKSPGGLARYGSLGNGGVIIVQTKDRAFARVDPEEKITESGTNENFYKGDAASLDTQYYVKPSYWSALNSSITNNEVLSVFEQFLPVYQDEAAFYFDVASKLSALGYDEKSARRVLDEMEDNLFYDPVALKSLAYLYQKWGKKTEALKAYQRIISLRPDYAQSFRDLANAYRSAGYIENSWNYYMNYLNKVEKLDEYGIGEIIYHEMEEIYFRRPRGYKPPESFVSKTELKDIPKDVRIVVEWDNSEAEFELEFVNPEGQAYSFIHTYEYNSQQIIDEKTKGYSSREFIIDELSKTGWLMNITYFGNKSENPTFFKVTHIQNWASRGQTEKISLVKLVEKNKKFQLLRL